MATPKVSRPTFPKGYVDNPTSYVDWSWVVAQLTDSKNYWLCSVRPPTPRLQVDDHTWSRAGQFIWTEKFTTMAVPRRVTTATLRSIRTSLSISKAEIKSSFLREHPDPRENLPLNSQINWSRNIAGNTLIKTTHPSQINGMKAGCMCSRLVNALRGRNSMKIPQSLLLKNRAYDRKNVAWQGVSFQS